MRQECATKDEMVYYTFWPILAFSFFIATDEIIPDNKYEISKTNASLLAVIIICKTFSHMFALSLLVLSLLESFLAFQYLVDPLCERLIFLELDAMIASVFIIVLTFCDCIHNYLDLNAQLSKESSFICSVIPWTMTIIILIYQTYRILTNAGFLKNSKNTHVNVVHVNKKLVK